MSNVNRKFFAWLKQPKPVLLSRTWDSRTRTRTWASRTRTWAGINTNVLRHRARSRY